MWVKCRFSDAGNDEDSRTLGAGQNGAQNTREIGYWDNNTTTAEPMEANSCETALYRGSGRLFRPRPGRPKRTYNSRMAMSPPIGRKQERPANDATEFAT